MSSFLLFLLKMGLLSLAVLFCTVAAGIVRAFVEPSNEAEPTPAAHPPDGSAEPPQPIPAG